MFDFVRKNNRVLQFVLFLLIVPSFLLFGLEGYRQMNDRGDTVAKVQGTSIHQSEWDAAHKQESDRLRQQMPDIDPKLLDSADLRYATLERMVRDRVIAAAADKSHLITGDARLAQELQRNQVIASLRGPDGRIDMARYRQLAAAQGMTTEMFEEAMRGQLSRQQVLGGVSASAFASNAQSDVALGAFLEKREVQVQRFDAADYAAKVSPTDAEIEAFYKNNPQLFQAPEQVNIEYLVLDVDSAMQGITVSEADLKAYFEQNQQRLSGPDERRASHILIAAPASAPAEQRAAAKKKAEDLLAQLKKNPDSFADLARKNSQDPGSAQRGGDLDFFARGAMTKPFEDAAFALKKGETSAVVETEFGYHIVRLTDIKTQVRKTFEEVRPQLEADLKKQQAQRKFAETADSFSNAVYEQSDNLKSASERFKLPLRTASGVTRQPAPNATGALANPKFLNALFSPDAIEKKRNTEATEVGPSQLASGRVVQHQAARTLPLAEVKNQVREQLRKARGVELARQAGRERLAALKANPQDAAGLAPAVLISREQTAKLDQQVIESALRADAAALPAAVGVDLADAGFVVVRVNKSVPRDKPAAPLAAQERQQVAQWTSGAEALAYYNLLKDRYKAQIRVPKPDAQAPAR